MTASITTTMFVTKPGVEAAVPFLSTTVTYFTVEDAQDALQATKDGWLAAYGDADVQADGSAVEAITGPGTKLYAEMDITAA